jgi:magnesium-protoporphyrin IX monomethyl ester (oxidative) cyclase
LAGRIKRILLVSPPVTRPADFSAKVVRVSVFFPLGLAYLAAALERIPGLEIRVLDAMLEGCAAEGAPVSGGAEIRYGVSDGDLARKIAEINPDIVGVSCLFAAMRRDAAAVCAAAKRVSPRIVTVMGGADAGANAVSILRETPSADYVLEGEGEVSLPALISALDAGAGFEKVDGLYFRKDGQVSGNPKRFYIEDLDSLPFPARRLFDMKKYFSLSQAHSGSRRAPFTQMITSRGCPFKCAFCALGGHWGPRQRRRGPENVLGEIGGLIKDHGVREIHFEDDNLTADKERALRIFSGIRERGYDITWNVPSGMAAGSLDGELLEAMRASGCYSVSLAIESGDQDVVSKLMSKPVNLKTIPGLVKKIRGTGMEARGFFILGYPGETRETIRKTIDFARSLELDWSYFFIASPLPNTKMWDDCVRNKYIRPEDFDPVRSFHRSIIRTPEFDPDYLAAVREEAILDVNFKNNPNLLKYDPGRAAAFFSDVVEKYPHFDFANFYLGEAFLKKGDTAAAAACFGKTLKINPNHREAEERLASLSGGSGH